MKPVLLDTVGLIATWDEDDQWHEPASHALEKLQAIRGPLVTTTYILAECGNTAARTTFRLEVDLLRARLQQAGRLIFPTEEDWRAAWDGYRVGLTGDAGLVDHLSFAVMRRMGLKEAFTNDRHFRAAGFRTLF